MSTILGTLLIITSLWSNLLLAGLTDIERREIELLVGGAKASNSSRLFKEYEKFIKERVVADGMGWEEIVARSKDILKLINHNLQTVELGRSGMLLKQLNILLLEVSVTPYYHYLDSEYNVSLDLLYDKIKLAEAKSSLDTIEAMYLAKMKLVEQTLTTRKSNIDIQTNGMIQHVRSWSAVEFFVHRYTIPEGTLEHRYVSLLDYEKVQASKLLQETMMDSILGNYIKVFAKSFGVGNEEVLFRFNNYFRRSMVGEIKKFFRSKDLANEIVVNAAMDFDLLDRDGADYQTIFMKLTQTTQYPYLQSVLVAYFDQMLKTIMDNSTVVQEMGSIRIGDIPKVAQIFSTYQGLIADLRKKQVLATADSSDPVELVSSFTTNYTAVLYLTPKPWLFSSDDFTKIEWAIDKFKSIKSHYEMVHVLGESSEHSGFLFKFLYATDNRVLQASLNEYVDAHAKIRGWRFKTDNHLKELVLQKPELLKDIFKLETMEMVNKDIMARIYEGTVDAFKNLQLLNDCNHRMINLN